jgi:hypothetical protein
MDDDRLLSGEEKRAQLREKFKRDLQQDKQLRDDLLRAQKANALARQVQAAEHRLLAPTEDTLDMLSKLREQTAWNEAKLDLALERRSVKSDLDGAFSKPAPRTPVDPIADALPRHLQTVVPSSQASDQPRRLSDGSWHNPGHDIELKVINRPKTLGNRVL